MSRTPGMIFVWSKKDSEWATRPNLASHD